MKRWGENEVLNYGNICLLKALKLAIQDMPKLIFENDVVLPSDRQSNTDYKCEIEGILQCFLEL